MTGARCSVTTVCMKTLLAQHLTQTLRKPARRAPTKNRALRAYQNACAKSCENLVETCAPRPYQKSRAARPKNACAKSCTNLAETCAPNYPTKSIRRTLQRPSVLEQCACSASCLLPNPGRTNLGHLRSVNLALTFRQRCVIVPLTFP